MEKPAKNTTEQSAEAELRTLPEVETLEEMQQHQERIEGLLKNFMFTEQAQDLAKELFDWAVEIDETIEKIKDLPEMDNYFIYNGTAFEPKNPETKTRYPLISGLNFLRSINSSYAEPYLDNFKPDTKGFMDSLYRTFVSGAKDTLRELEKKIGNR